MGKNILIAPSLLSADFGKLAEEVNARLGRILDESLNEIYIFDSTDFRFMQVNRGAEENL